MFAERLLRGVWDYEAMGLLDKGHLRWFSLETMRKALAEMGLVACDVHPRIFNGERAAAFATAIAPGLRALGVDPQAYADRAAPLQYVWRVRKKPRTVLTIAANMLAPVGGVSHLRVVYPMRAMSTDPSVLIRMGSVLDISPRDGEVPRIFVLHRPTGRVPSSLVESAARRRPAGR